MSAPTSETRLGAWSTDVRFYLAGILDEITQALRIEDNATADQLAALYFALERDERVRMALSIAPTAYSGARSSRALAERWERLRVRCCFPTPRDVATAKSELAAVPTRPGERTTARTERQP